MQAGCLDTPDSRLRSATFGQIQSCTTLVSELQDNDADCSLDLTPFGFPGTPRDLCCRSCKDADLYAGSAVQQDMSVGSEAGAEGGCAMNGQFQWTSGPRMERFEQTVDRCSKVSVGY